MMKSTQMDSTVRPMSSLYQLSLNAFCCALDPPARNVYSIEEDISIVNHLPPSVQRDVTRRLKQRWMLEVQPPFNPLRHEYRYIEFENLDKFEFIMLQHFPPNHFVDFWPCMTYDKCHLYFKYYIFIPSNGPTRYLCRQCFVKVSDPLDYDDNDPQYVYGFQTYWKQKGWKFLLEIKHYGVSRNHFVNTIVKSDLSWCDRCVVMPLFKLYNWSDCKDLTQVHTRSYDYQDNDRNYEDEDDDDIGNDVSEANIIEYYNTKALYTPYHYDS